MGNDTKEKFQSSKWVELMQNDSFKQRVHNIMDEEIIFNFEKREGSAEDYYNIDPEE